MGRRYPAQIVAMCKPDMAAWVKAQAEKDEETVAGELRLQVRQSMRLRAVAEKSGYSVDDLLSYLEKSTADQA